MLLDDGGQTKQTSMTSRDLVIRTLNHEPADRVPRDLWYAPGVETSRADEVAEIEIRYPRDIVPPDYENPAGKWAKGNPYIVGCYTDAWGCEWHVAEQGTIGEVKEPPLTSAANIVEYKPPMELVDGAKLSRTNRHCAATSRFVLARTETGPFHRLQLLCGAKATCSDLASGAERIRSLLATLHDFFCREMEMWAGSDVDGVQWRDDWGSPDALRIAPGTWRELFKPLYRDYCEILHAKDKFAFFRSDGKISDIFSDLVKIGVDAIHAQLPLMDIERLAKRFRGRVTFCGEIDRQRVLPQGALDEIRDAVLKIRKALDFGRGGLIAQCEWGSAVPLRNVAAVFEQWMLPLPVHAA